jgi:hypothetical protein
MHAVKITFLLGSIFFHGPIPIDDRAVKRNQCLLYHNRLFALCFSPPDHACARAMPAVKTPHKKNLPNVFTGVFRMAFGAVAEIDSRSVI